jgi:hypothetical protein
LVSTFSPRSGEAGLAFAGFEVAEQKSRAVVTLASGNEAAQ